MKIQIMGGKIAENLGFDSPLGRSIFFCPRVALEQHNLLGRYLGYNRILFAGQKQRKISFS